eukprot:GILK01002821.1.p1 GENE.GILK01002821.1~~GILK01002821.1.p1  ORF type:complete len:258 (+),score=43.25 GILK01002821.1:45-776(+)
MDDELDNILDDALEDFGSSQSTAPATDQTNTNDTPDEKVLADFAESMSKALADLNLQPEDGAPLDGDFAETMQKALAELNGDPENMGDFNPAAMEGLFSQFERMGDQPEFQGMMDQLMKQLLSKDVMYDPIALVVSKFPEYLEKNKEKLSPEDLERYNGQFLRFQEVLRVYDTEPENMDRVVFLMEQLQSYGPPPQEILAELGPGNAFGPDGNLFANAFSSMPSMPGMPSLDPAMLGKGCSIM